MSTNDIENRTLKIVSSSLKLDDDKDINLESSYIDDLGADSLDTMDLVMALEEEFDIEIPDEDAHKITTVKATIEYIKEKI